MSARCAGRRLIRQTMVALPLLFACSLPGEAVAQAAPDQAIDFTVGDIAFLGDGPDMGVIGAGAFNVIPNDDIEGTAGELRLEYRHGGRWHAIGPMVGIMANSDGGLFGYGGLYTDIQLADRWIVTPMGGIGAYAEGGGKDLGGTFQFHLGLEVSYQFDGGSRLGLRMAHISNAWLHDENPGVESALLTYTIPLGGLFDADR